MRIRTALLSALLLLCVISNAQNKPTLYLVGDSTMAHNWGWGDACIEVFDADKITVINKGFSGETTRSCVGHGRWSWILERLQPGDFVLIDLGQNDNGGRPEKCTLPGNGEEAQPILVPKTCAEEMMHTFGYYMRQMGTQAMEKGATVLFTSYTAWNIWRDGVLDFEQGNDFATWTKEAAEQIGAYYLDIFSYEYEYYSKLTPEETQTYFQDDSHLTAKGAAFTAAHFAEQLREYKECPLGQYLREDAGFSPKYVFL